MSKEYDPFADIRNKRMSELSEEQRDRATELWLRENALTFGRYYSEGKDALFPSLFREIDRLREKARALDALVEVLQDTHTHWAFKRVAVTGASGVLVYKDVPVYEWRLRADGVSDIREAIMQLLTKEPR